MAKSEMETNARLSHIDALLAQERTRIQVTFKVFPEGDIIALWDEDVGRPDMMASYQNIGQHSPASRELLDELVDAKPEEYKALKIELENRGYLVEVMNE